MIKNAGAKICISGYRGGSLLYDRYLNKDTGWHTYMIGEVTRSAGMYGAKKGNPYNKAQEFIWTNYDVPGGASNFFNTYDFALDWDDIGDFMEQRKMA